MTDPSRPDDAPDLEGGQDAPDVTDEPDARGASRRAFLRRAGLGGAGLLGLGLAGHEVGAATGLHGHAEALAAPADGPVHATGTVRDPGVVDGRGVVGDAAVSANYGHGVSPPLDAPDGLLDAVTFPPGFDGRPPGQVREYEIDVLDTSLLVAHGTVARAWTYGGRAPGPVLRATEGDTLRVHLRNRTDRPHNLHLHGRHSPQMDGWEPIPPGGEFTYEVTAEPFGLHPYHCHTPPLAMHVAKGLYGAFLVDPPGGRPPAHEVVLLLSGWDLDDDGRNELVAWNGVAGWYQRHPITVPVGELVRVHVLNMLEHEPVASFHLHAQTFDVFWHGTSLEPDLHADTIALTQGDRAIVEFTLPERGRYMFHPHQHRLADMGAIGWFAAV